MPFIVTRQQVIDHLKIDVVTDEENDIDLKIRAASAAVLDYLEMSLGTIDSESNIVCGGDHLIRWPNDSYTDFLSDTINIHYCTDGTDGPWSVIELGVSNVFEEKNFYDWTNSLDAEYSNLYIRLQDSINTDVVAYDGPYKVVLSDDQYDYPYVVQMAVLLIVGDLYRHRDSEMPSYKGALLSPAVRALLYPLKTWGIDD